MSRTIQATLFLIVVLPCAACGGGTDTTADQDPFAAAFQAERYADALTLAETQLVQEPEEPVWLLYRGMCLAALDRPEEAAEALRAATLRLPTGFRDRHALLLQARALNAIGVRRRALQVLDKLETYFPHSRVAQQGQELALLIDKNSTPDTVEDLGRLLARGLASQEARPALAVELLEEYLLRTPGAKDLTADQAHAHRALAAAYEKLGATREAAEHLERAPPEATPEAK